MKRSKDVDEATSNSGLIGFQTVWIIGIFKLHSGLELGMEQGSCIILASLLQLESCEAQSSWKNPSHKISQVCKTS